MLLNTLKLKVSLRCRRFRRRTHPYDWRRSVGGLAGEVDGRIEPDDDRRSVMLVGHGMGGLVARVALGRQRCDRITRVVQLGAPNHGSFAPVLALRGVYPSVRKLAAIDRAAYEPKTSRASCSARCRRCTNCCRSRRSRGGLDLFDAAAWPDDELRPAPALLAAAPQRAGAVAGESTSAACTSPACVRRPSRRCS